MKFYPKEHRYEEDQVKWVSASGVVDFYKQEFDGEYWLTYKAYELSLFPGINDDAARKKAFRNFRMKNLNMVNPSDPRLFKMLSKYTDPKVFELNRKLVQHRWETKNQAAREKGSEYHDYQEKSSIANGIEVNPWTGELMDVIVPYKWTKGVKEGIVNLNELREGYYPEIIIYHDMICGQVDKLWISNNREFFVGDFKTNEKIVMENRYSKMKFPLHRLDDSNYNHYRVQLSVYAWIMIQKGYKLGGLMLNHFNETYELEYIENMDEVIEHLKANK